MERLTADDVKQLLGLRPHPREGGWFVRVYEASEMISPENFADDRYDGPRRTGTAIYYLLEPETFSEMHVLESDEIFHHYAGDPVEMLQLFPDGTGRKVILGGDLTAGQQVQTVVPRGVWQGSRLVSGGKVALLGCTVSPGFEYEDYESGNRADLTRAWEEWTEAIAKLTRG